MRVDGMEIAKRLNGGERGSLMDGAEWDRLKVSAGKCQQ